MPPDIQPFHAMSIGRQAFSMEEAGHDILHMEYGQPSAQPPAAVRAAAAEMLAGGVKGYWESDGLKAGIAAMYRDVHGMDVPTDQIVLTCGASPALALALMAGFAPGARIAMSRPGYVAHRNCVTGLHMEAVELPCGPETRFQLTADMLAALDPAPHGVILASPANPTGSIIPAAELSRIIDLCTDRGIQIISDEIYNWLTYGERAPSVGEFTDHGFLVNSFSKFFAMPGWRLGWLVAPEAHARRAHAYMSNFFLTPPSLSQAAGLAALEEIDALGAHLSVYRQNRENLLTALPGMGLSDIAPPDGAFYIYAKTDQFAADSRTLCAELLAETGVATASGVDFDPVAGQEFMRFSFALSVAQVEEAIARITPWFAARRR